MDSLTLQIVPLASIAIEASRHPRVAMRAADIDAYAAAMEEGAAFPPLVLFSDGAALFVADGFHRIRAARQIGRTELLADIRSGSADDALWYALGVRIGLPYSLPDKRHAIDLALEAFAEQQSLNRIAAQIGCSRRMVQRAWHERAALAPSAEDGSRILRGKDGRRYRCTPGERAVRIPAAGNASTVPVTESVREQIRALLQEGCGYTDIAQRLRVRQSAITEEKYRLGLPIRAPRPRKTTGAYIEQIRDLASSGHSSRQIAEQIGVSFAACRRLARRAGIRVTADLVMGRTRRHDANRIVAHIVSDAEQLIADLNLIDFAQLDYSRLPLWLKSLMESREKLGAFIRRLMKERGKHGEAA